VVISDDEGDSSDHSSKMLSDVNAIG